MEEGLLLSEGECREGGACGWRALEETLPQGDVLQERQAPGPLLPQALGGDTPRTPGEQVPCACAWSSGLRQTALQACGGGDAGGRWWLGWGWGGAGTEAAGSGGKASEGLPRTV